MVSVVVLKTAAATTTAVALTAVTVVKTLRRRKKSLEAMASIPSSYKRVKQIKRVTTKVDSQSLVKGDAFKGIFELEEVPMPEIKPGEVEAASINPSDVLFVSGRYNQEPGKEKEIPADVGFEGCGSVVQVGSFVDGLFTKVGQRVGFACMNGGAYSEYLVLSCKSLIPLSDKIPPEQGAAWVVNPLTALAMIDEAHAVKAKAIVHTAAASQLGKMLIRLCKSNNLKIVAVVRKEEQAKTCTELGATCIINTSKPGWEEEFKDMAEKLEVKMAFEAVGGEIAGAIMKNMPPKTTTYSYGLLSGQNISDVDPYSLIFQGKVLRGFWLTDILQKKNLLQQLLFFRRAGAILATDLKTDVRATYGIDEVGKAMMDYMGNMGGGKVVIMPK